MGLDIPEIVYFNKDRKLSLTENYLGWTNMWDQVETCYCYPPMLNYAML